MAELAVFAAKVDNPDGDALPPDVQITKADLLAALSQPQRCHSWRFPSASGD